ncbi:MAG: TetR/AcrR family transcriptional regulator [Candidatus Delongbacteria bacterium]
MSRAPSAQPLRREHVLAAAVRRFAFDPFHLVDMESIAREAGVGKGTLYRYFRGKDELFLAAVEYQLEDALGCIHRQAAGETRPADYLRAIIHGAVDYFLARPEGFRLVQLAHGSRQPEVAATVERVRARQLPVFEARMAAARRAGELEVSDAQLLLRVLDASIVQLLGDALGEADPTAALIRSGARIKAHLPDLLLRGLLPRRTEA